MLNHSFQTQYIDAMHKQSGVFFFLPCKRIQDTAAWAENLISFCFNCYSKFIGLGPVTFPTL